MIDTFKPEYLLLSEQPHSSAYETPDIIGMLHNTILVNISNAEQYQLINEVTRSTIRIIESINASTNDGTLSAVFVAFIGALSAFLFSFFQQVNDRRINKIKNTSQSIMDLITKLEEVSLKYWVTGYNPAKKDEIMVDEAIIRSLNPLIGKYTDKLLSFLSERTKRKYNAQQLSIFSSQIFGLTTGGDFESPNRLESKGTATAISKKCLEAVTIIKSISP